MGSNPLTPSALPRWLGVFFIQIRTILKLFIETSSLQCFVRVDFTGWVKLEIVCLLFFFRIFFAYIHLNK